MIETISPADVSALLSMIEPSWAARTPVVQAISSIEGGDWWSAPDIADLTGRTPGRARQQLAELTAARVILRDGGTGGRKFWCEVNPDWRQWDVPWRHPRRVVRQKLADIRERRSASALQRFIASPKHSRYAELNASLCTRDTAQREAAEAALSRALGTRDNAHRRTPYREPRDSRSGGAVSRVPRARDKSGLREEEEKGSSSRSSRDVDQSPPQPPEPPPKVDPVERAQARRAVTDRCRGAHGRKPFLSGKPSEQFDVLLAQAGLDAVLVGVEKIEPGVHLPPRFVEHLIDVVLAGDQLTLGLEMVPADPTPEELEVALARVRQEIANHRALDVQPPVEMLFEEAALLDQLGALPATPGEP